MFAKRINNVPRSFIREILKVTEDPSIISFAGGLPNAKYFPQEAISIATQKVLSEEGNGVLQYSTTEGLPELREYIANRYRTKKGLSVESNEILIVNGSQQALDLIGKVLIDQGDGVIIEKPGYLGAIQAFSLYQPTFRGVPLESDGPDLSVIEQIMNNESIKLFYTVPNFQNPSGISYSLEKRKSLASLMEQYSSYLVEDDPYGELRFMGEQSPSMKKFLDNKTIMLGSFSKTVAPAMRMGWVCAKGELMNRLVIAKQAADLHSNSFSQKVLIRYLSDNNVEDHIKTICKAYGKQRDVMIEMIKKHFPSEISYTQPEGGMFLWVTLPKGISSMEAFDAAILKKVAFVPGFPFYVDGEGENTLRLNYSNSSEDRIAEGIVKLSEVFKELIQKHNTTGKA